MHRAVATVVLTSSSVSTARCYIINRLRPVSASRALSHPSLCRSTLKTLTIARYPLKKAETIKYIYFNMRGRGELVRLLLHAAGVEFTDQRIELTDWLALKPTTPFGTLPYIELDGKAYGEYLPICRFLARKYGLAGKTEIEQLEADIIVNLTLEIREAFIQFKEDSLLTEEQKVKAEGRGQFERTVGNTLAEIFKIERIPMFCEIIEKFLTESKSGFLVGSELTMADLAVMDIFDHAMQANPDCLTDQFPKTKEHRDRIFGIPAIKKYLSERPTTFI